MSGARSRLESAALVVAMLLVAAFIVSFILGVVPRRDPTPEVVEAPELLPAAPGESKGRVEVLNASGRAGLARAATMQLREQNFDVVYFGNASERRDSSLVLARVANRSTADAAAATLQITTIRSQPEPKLLLDATIIIGLDWRERQVQAQAAQQTGWKAKAKKWLGRGD